MGCRMAEPLEKRPGVQSPSKQRPAFPSIFGVKQNSQASQNGTAMASNPSPTSPKEFKELQEWFAFAGQFFADFRTTASVIPSSPQLARKMVEPVSHGAAKTVVEFGPGTGPMTAKILESMGEDSLLYGFEINPRFVSYLNERFQDKRLHVKEMGAEKVNQVLEADGRGCADAVISSLPLSFFPRDLRHQILSEAARALAPEGVFTQFQYASGLDCSGPIPKPYELRPLLLQYFTRVERHLVWRNFPPAWVYHCYVR